MKIERLNPSVVNRIAAGEIIHHPYNAVKELTENSLDAGATHIQIDLIHSGLGSIKIIDNGKGIKVDDMPLVCERYATSKLKEFKDLLKLETFGFRGEALSSISQISNVIIVSKPRDNSYGYLATYKNGKMVSKPKLCASNVGTIVQNLFENTPIRKKGLRSHTEEYHRILDVFKKYAIHNSNVQFTLKREKNTEMTSQATLSQLDRIQQVYGTCISSCLKTMEYSDGNCQFKIIITDTKSQPNYHQNNKKTCIFILFVNNRLVDNNNIKREIKQAYTGKTSGINASFTYISLTVKPSHVDVNIHPTKSEVHLLNEEEITDKITTTIKGNLSSPTQKKKTHVRLPEKATLNHYFKPVSANKALSTESDTSSSVLGTPPPSPKGTKTGNINNFFKNVNVERKTIAENNHSLLLQTTSPVSFQPTGINENSVPHQRTSPGSYSTTKGSIGKVPYQKAPSSPLQPIDMNRTCEIHVSPPSTEQSQKEIVKRRTGVNLKKLNPTVPTKVTSVPTVPELSSTIKETTPPTTEINLAQENLQNLDSIVTIKSEIQQAENKSISKMFTRNQCVGIIDDVLVIVTFKERFYLINYNTVSEEYFYQLVLYHLGKFGNLFLSSPISIKSCISLFIPNTTDQELDTMVDSLLCHKDLLASYYNIKIVLSAGIVQLVCLPMILVNYKPSLDKLPIFLHNIATQIEWGNEIECLDAIAREISSFYCCCSKTQCSYFLQSTRDGNFKAPNYLSEKGYITELDFPNEILA